MLRGKTASVVDRVSLSSTHQVSRVGIDQQRMQNVASVNTRGRSRTPAGRGSIVGTVQIQDDLTGTSFLCGQGAHITAEDRPKTGIKRLQESFLSMDRVLQAGESRFLANQFRLLLHALAYQMFVRLATICTGPPGTSSKSKPYVVVSSRSGPGSFNKPLDASGSIFPQPFPNNPSSTSS